MNSYTRALWIIAIALGVFVIGLLSGCANTPVQRSTDTPSYSMREGQSVFVKFMPREQIADYARKHTDAAYRADAVAMWSGDICIVWMPVGSVNLYLLNHELAHCAGLKHDRNGIWEN